MSNERDLCMALQHAISSQYACSRHGEFDRVRTPYLYPDGDYIDLFCKRDGDVATITDLGETNRWLRMQTLSQRRTTRQRSLIDDICQTHGVEFYRGMILARSRNESDLADTVTRVAQAAFRISDLWLTFRTRSVESLSDEVADFLSERQLPHNRGERRIGRSGRTWTVDFHVRTPAKSSLVYVLTTGNRSAARSVVEHVVAAWYDLNILAAGPEALQFVSLFDDTLDVWTAEDYRLVEPLSVVRRWSEPERFAEELTLAA